MPSPKFFFQIDEIRQHPDVHHRFDRHGNWEPSTDRGANIDYTASAGVSGKQWFCDGQQIHEVAQRSHEAQLYKEFSAYYVGGVGFYVLKGDARHPPNDDVWHTLQFACYDSTYSSYLTNAGQSQTLYRQPQDRRWADLLLPTTNHTHNLASSPNHGGLVGELPILLALIAFSTSREYLPNVLPHTFQDGAWMPTHQWQFERISERGVVVKVYTYPRLSPQSMDPTGNDVSRNELYNYELGTNGKYFY